MTGGAALAWPVAVRAQQTLTPVIGFLNSASPTYYPGLLRAYLDGLEEAGFVDGRNVKIEYRWAEGRYDRLAALAADLIDRQVTVIAATSTPAALVARAATGKIPVVFTTSSDPVQLGLVANLGRPGGNVTGATQITAEVAPKRLELAHQLVPDASSIGLLVNPTSPVAENLTRDLQAAARTLGLHLVIQRASNDSAIDDAFEAAVKAGVGALVIISDPFFTSRDKRLAALTLRHRLPTIYQYREFTVEGGLISYGGSLTDTYRQAGIYTGRIVKGDKPADLPVVRAAKIELIINLKTAKALGVTVPPAMLVRADELIE